MVPRFSTFVLCFVGVFASQQSSDCNTVVNGVKPSGVSPYVSLRFSDVTGSPGTVKCTITNNLPSTNYINNFLFNCKSAPSQLTASYQSGQKADGFFYGNQTASLKAGTFNVGFQWKSTGSSGMCGGKTTVYYIQGNGLSADDFDSGSELGYKSACDVKGGSSGTTVVGSGSCSRNPCNDDQTLVTYTPPASCQKNSASCNTGSCPGTVKCNVAGCGGYTAGAACTNSDAANSPAVANFQYCARS